jgi:hypothetical protein
VLAVRDAIRVGLVLGCLGTLGGCKPAAAPRVPRGGDLDGYLAALENNESDLRAAGIYVTTAPAGQAAAPAGDSTPAPEPVEADFDDEAAPMDAPMATEAYGPEPAADRVQEKSAPRRSAFKAKERRADDDRCTRICDLAEMACELEARICELADKHDDDPRYADACTRAQLQCETAADACRSCE